MTHDYTEREWDHDYVIHAVKDGGQELEASGWGYGINPGDYLIMPNKGRTTRYKVSAIQYYSDPPDMWAATLAFAPRAVELTP